MKILQINSVCGIGSTGRICTDLLEILLNDNHEGYICYGREQAPKKFLEKSKKIGNKLDTIINVIENRIFDNAGYGTKIYTKKLLKWIDEYEPDIIHLHNIHGYYINIKLLFSYIKEKNINVVWTFHDCWPFTGHCTYFDKIGCNKWKSECIECDYTYSYPKCYLKSNVKKNYERKKETFLGVNNLTIVTPSKWLANLVKQSFLKDYEVQVVHNGIDTKIFRPIPSDFKEKYNLKNKVMVLGVASGWGERKGLSDFIKLSKKLDDHYKIVLVGIEKGDISNAPNNIMLIDKTNDIEELVKIYSAADIFLNLTYEDNYPTVNLEAQACGTPVITYKTGGSVESVPEENVVEQGDIMGVIDLMIKVDELRIFNEKERLDKFILFRRYIEIYRELLKNR